MEPASPDPRGTIPENLGSASTSFDAPGAASTSLDALSPDSVRSASAGSPLREPGRLLPRAIATLDPGYFAFVMATGIVSIGTHLLGYDLLSEVILGFAAAGFLVLLAAYLARFVFFQPFVRQSAADPTVAMAYFTVVAGTDVLATRFALAGHPLVAFGLGCGAAVVWVLLTYGLPGSIVAAAHRPVLREINGTWLVWVVSTQSLSIIATAVAPHAPASWLQRALPSVAVSLWGLGVMLYLVLIVIIFLRLLVVEVTPAEMGPAYWIAMGATAISVRAAAGILALHDPDAQLLVTALRPFVVGLSVVLWAFGTWWIPLLVLFGVWRYVLRRYPRSYEPRLWNMVFPLGMYTVASFSLGQTPGLGFMVAVARVWVWVGVAAWVGVLCLMGSALVCTLHRQRSDTR